MAKARRESGEQRQKRIQREQHRPEQDRGYDEAVRGGPETANEMHRVDTLLPTPPDQRPADEAHNVDERETRGAVDDVRRRERTADKRRRR